jgi:hypothetical protein
MTDKQQPSTKKPLVPMTVYRDDSGNPALYVGLMTNDFFFRFRGGKCHKFLYRDLSNPHGAITEFCSENACLDEQGFVSTSGLSLKANHMHLEPLLDQRTPLSDLTDQMTPVINRKIYSDADAILKQHNI